MTTVTLSRKEIEKRLGKFDEEMAGRVLMAGVEVDGMSEDEIVIDVTPNRPDLLSLQGFANYMEGILGKKKKIEIKAEKPAKDYVVSIEKSVKKVRPHTACAIVKGLKFDDEKIKEIVDIQEKLHLTLGRKRKKVAIGIYPLEKIKMPIRFVGKKPDEIKFKPLEFPREITGAQILRQHPTGRDYAELLKDCDVYPVFYDAENKVLSMPPIINSHETGKIGYETKDVFVECSGHNLYYLKKCLNIIVNALAGMGGKIYSVKVEDGKDSFVSPDFSKEKIEFKVEDINKTLGVEFSEKQIKDLLGKMGIEVVEEKKGKEKKLFGLVPAYRVDVMHWVDLAEDVAIAYGYDKFEPEIPDISTIGEEDFLSVLKKKLAEILAGAGLLECSSYHLASKKEVKKAHFEFNEFIEVEDSKTEYNVLRIDLLSNLLKILSENSDSAYPQKIFELGRVFEIDKENKTDTGVKEKENLGIVFADEKISFSDMKSLLDYFFKMLGKEYQIEETEDNNYIPGRVGKIIVGGKAVGVIGEVAPRVLKNWGIGVPVVGVEIGVGWLGA